MDKLQEACGVIGICATGTSKVAEKVYLGLLSLQHRGQESAGITVVSDQKLKTHKAQGLVAEAFKDISLSNWPGQIAIGHTRYATTGASDLTNAQPIERTVQAGQIAIAHNGNLVNAHILREFLSDSGVSFETASDSEVLLTLIARKAHKGYIKAISSAMALVKGSFSIVIASNDALIGVRDARGIRPLCLGVLKDGSHVLASENCAIEIMGGKLLRDVKPGEVIILKYDPKKQKVVFNSYNYTAHTVQTPCSFEHIYFSRPDSVINGIDVFQFRKKCGRLLYEQNPLDADVVMGVPDSGVPAAIGFANASKIPFSLGLVKNKYLGRSFIEPSQDLREHLVSIKLNPLRSEVVGKKVVLVDDSLVRGTTSQKLIAMLREAGAAKVHFYSASPQVRFPCFFGIDMPSKEELIAANLPTSEEIRHKIKADSLVYLSLENLKNALDGLNHCVGCFSGIYPMLTHQELRENSHA